MSFGIILRNNEIAVFVQISTNIVAKPSPKAFVTLLETANNGQSPNNCTNALLFFQTPSQNSVDQTEGA